MFFSQKDLTAAANDPFAPGGTAVNTGSDPGKTPGMELPSGQWVVVQMVVPCLAKLFVLSNIYTVCPSDPFAAVFGNESFGLGFADFSALAKVKS